MGESLVHSWSAQVKKGLLSFIVLNMLRKRRYYGYELIDEIKKTTDIDIAEGTLYPLLNRLKEDELVESVWVEQPSGIPRKYYTLTAKGEENLLEMRRYWVDVTSSIQKLFIL